MQTSQEIDIVLVANSPGELSALVRPVAKRFKQKLPSSRIILFLTPCQYSSGCEVEFAQKNLEVDFVVSQNEYRQWLIKNTLPNNLSLNKKGVVVFMGGDLLHAMLIAKKLGFKAYAYLAGQSVSLISFFEKFFVPDKKIFNGKIPEPKMIEVGDLMSEPLMATSREESLQKWKLDPKRKKIAFMPGSRLWEIRHLMPIYGKIIYNLKAKDPSIQSILIISPFTQFSDVEKFKESSLFDVFTPFDSITAADLVVTIPGTNTAQVAALGLPMIVVFPLDKPDAIPMPGLSYYITSIPLIGNLIKKMMVNIIASRTKYFALPNIKANRAIVPEIKGKIDPQKTANMIYNIINDESHLDQMSLSLKEIMKQTNASSKIVEEIINENPE